MTAAAIGPPDVTRPTEDNKRRIDAAGAERAVRSLLAALGYDPDSEHLKDTPRRVRDAYVELLTPPAFKPTMFSNDAGYAELVVARDIPFTSLCQHHLLPFSGVAHVGYVPGRQILGLSKLARVVERYARDLQVQERLTTQVASWLSDHLGAAGRCRADGRAPVHVAARGQSHGVDHRHLIIARRRSRCRDTGAVPSLRRPIAGSVRHRDPCARCHPPSRARVPRASAATRDDAPQEPPSRAVNPCRDTRLSLCKQCPGNYI